MSFSLDVLRGKVRLGEEKPVDGDLTENQIVYQILGLVDRLLAEYAYLSEERKLTESEDARAASLQAMRATLYEDFLHFHPKNY